MSSAQPPPRFLCLVTNAGYAPGAVCLAQSLALVGSAARLVVIATSPSAEAALLAEAEKCPGGRASCPMDVVLEEHALPPADTSNGGGKTHYVMRETAALQRGYADMGGETTINYRRVPFRESSSAATLVDLLSHIHSSGGGADGQEGSRNVLHLDIGHIIPENANTVLFQLLLVGVLRDTKQCRVYHRSPNDVIFVEGGCARVGHTRMCGCVMCVMCAMMRRTVFCVHGKLQQVTQSYVQLLHTGCCLHCLRCHLCTCSSPPSSVPNSRGNKTAEALRLCALLPSHYIEVTAANLDLKRPIFTDDEGTQVGYYIFQSIFSLYSV